MKQLFIFFTTLLLFTSQQNFAQIKLDYSTTTTCNSFEVPYPKRSVTVLENGDIEVNYSFSSALLNPDDIYPNTYSWKIGGFGNNITPGQASVPIRIDSFEIPDNKTATLTVSSVDYCYYSYSLAPAREPICESLGLTYTSDNVKPIISSSQLIPASNISISGIEEYRGVRFVNILFCPVQYISSTHTVKAVKNIKYTINFHGPSASGPSKISSLNNLSLCPDDAIAYNSTGGTSPKPEYDISNNLISTSAIRVDRTIAIITTDNIKSTLSNFIEWKKSQGYKIVIKSSSNWTYESIKSATDDLFNTEPNFYHLLLIGNSVDLPGKRIYSNLDETWNYHDTDYYYSVYSDSSTDIPSISVGRIPTSDLNDISDILQKTIDYEKNPSTSNTSSQLTSIAYFQDNDRNSYEDVRFAETGNEIFNYIKENTSLGYDRIFYTESNKTPLHWSLSYSNGLGIPEELKKPIFLWNGSSSDINKNLNSGVSILFYRGHGNPLYWYAPYYSYYHISNLTNNKLPIIFSICCLTGRYESDNNFALSFIKTKKHGAACIVGASSLSYSLLNDVFAKSIINSIWPNPGLQPWFESLFSYNIPTPSPIAQKTIGDIFIQSLKTTSETLRQSYSQYYQHTQEVFHIFGDPSMLIHTEPIINASSFSTVRRSDPTANSLSQLGFISVSLTRNAYIGLYNMATGETKRYYGKKVFQDAVAGDNWIATVYDSNVKPLYSANITIGGGPIVKDPIPFDVIVNSSNNLCKIKFNNDFIDNDENCEVEVRDEYGNIVFHENITNYNETTIDLASKKSGIYIVSLLINGIINNSKHIIL